MSDNLNKTNHIEPKKNQGILDQQIIELNKYQFDLKTKWGVFSLIIATVVGFLGHVAYDYTKNLLLPTDQYLVAIRDEQSKQYEDLKNSLSELKWSIDSSESRSAFKTVSKYSEELVKSNKDLLNQLELAKRENESLSKITQQKSGFLGGYDFILTEGSSMRIDNSTIVGLENAWSRQVKVNITAASIANNKNSSMLNAGQSVEYQNALGKNCKVTVLSVSKESASFGNSCS